MMITIDALKELATTLGVTSPTGDNVADVIKYIADNYTPATGLDLKHKDVTFTNITAGDWSQSYDGMYYIDRDTYESLGLHDITPMAISTVDWAEISDAFTPCITATGVGLTCATNMSIGSLILRLIYIQN